MKEELKAKYESYLALRKGSGKHAFLVIVFMFSVTFGWIPAIIVGLIGVTVLLVVIFILIVILRKIPSPPLQPPENYMFLRLCDTLINLEYYFGDPTSIIHLHRARKNLENLMSSIRKLTPKSYSVIVKAFDEPLQRLSTNLENRILPLIFDSSSQKDVQQAYSRLESLAFIFIEPTTIAQNLSLCNKILEEIPEIPEIITYKFQLSTFFSAHKILGHILVVSTFIIGCCIFYYIATNYLEIAKEYAFTGSIAIFIGLVTVYFRKQPTEPPRT